MIVFHGTAGCLLELIQKSQPITRQRCYVPRPSFCTTTDFNVAKLFAFRKTSIEAFQQGKITGIVLEYELAGNEPADWQRVRDPRCFLEEHEVAIYNVKKLRQVGVWRFDTNWRRGSS